LLFILLILGKIVAEKECTTIGRAGTGDLVGKTIIGENLV
jgi:hypothetical protein